MASSDDLIARARAGDGEAFGALVEPYRRELHVHCYRLLGSVQDAEDVLQEVLLAAWRGLDRYEERASLRTWMYRIATNRCLNAMRAESRRPRPAVPPSGVRPPKPTRLDDVGWLDPYPDTLLEGLADDTPGPEARYEQREAVALAFVAALQVLTLDQRAVLVLRDVLGFSAAETADILTLSESAVASRLLRARAALRRRQDGHVGHAPPPATGSPTEQAIVAELARAWEAADVPGIVALLTEDAWLTMPPLPLAYQGLALAAEFLSMVAFRGERRYRLVPTRANGQPAFGVYLCDPHSAVGHASGLLVCTLAGDKVSALTRFDVSTFPLFGLPRTLPD